MRALIIGGAACVWDDLARAEALADFDALVAVNDAGTVYPGDIAIWATLHPEHLSRWTKQRADNGHPPVRRIAVHSNNTQQGRDGAFAVDIVTDYRWPGMAASGSSGLFACKVALEQGYTRQVLCGVPMVAASAHFFDPAPWAEVGGFTEAWKTALPHIRDHVRSMSGWTRELLGEPTSEWLAGTG